MKKNAKISKKTYRTNLERIAKENGYNATKLSEELYYSKRMMQHYFAGESPIPEGLACTLADKFKCSVAYIQGESHSPKVGIMGVFENHTIELHEKYDKTLDLLEDIGIRVAQDDLTKRMYIHTDTDTVYIDAGMLWFICDTIKSQAKSVVESYIHSGVSVVGSKGLQDIEPDMFTCWDTDAAGDTDTDTDTRSEIVIEARTQKEINGRMKSLGDDEYRKYEKQKAKLQKAKTKK